MEKASKGLASVGKPARVGKLRGGLIFRRLGLHLLGRELAERLDRLRCDSNENQLWPAFN